MIRFNDVSKSYGHGDVAVHAVKNLTLEIPSGVFTAIIGASGSGKTTLLHLLGALDRPTTGTVEVNGENLGAMNDAERTRYRREKVGFVFQFFNLLPTMSAIENVCLPAELSGKPGAWARERASALLDQVKLGHRKGHRPDSLSGGEMQRVAIARALVMDPPLIIADEPTGNLDSKTGSAVLEVLKSAAGGERSLILVTHDKAVAERADQVLTMRDGRLMADAG